MRRGVANGEWTVMPDGRNCVADGKLKTDDEELAAAVADSFPLYMEVLSVDGASFSYVDVMDCTTL